MQRDNFNTIREIIETRAKDNWIDTEIAYDDIPYYPTKGIDYIAISILFGESENSGLGSMGFQEAPIRENGVLLVQVFTAANMGNQRALEIAGKVRELYQNTDENGLAFYVGSLIRIGEANDRLQYNVSIEFYYQ